MPSLQDIERFKAVLNSLGSEEEILAERGESIEDLPPPASGPPDLSDLFAGEAPLEREAPQGLETPSGSGISGEPEVLQGSETFPEAKPPADEFDLSSLLGEEGMEELGKLELSPETAGGEAPAEEIEIGPPPGEEPATGRGGSDEEEAARTLEEFGIPPGLLDSLGEQGGPSEARQPEEEGALPEAEPEPAGPVTEEELPDFTLPADFGIHEEGMEAGGEPMEAGGEPAPVPQEGPPSAEAGEIIPEDFFAEPAVAEAPLGPEEGPPAPEEGRPGAEPLPSAGAL